MIVVCLMRDIDGITCNYRHYSLLAFALLFPHRRKRQTQYHFLYPVPHSRRRVFVLSSHRCRRTCANPEHLIKVAAKTTRKINIYKAHWAIKRQLISSLFKNNPLWLDTWDNKQQIAHQKHKIMHGDKRGIVQSHRLDVLLNIIACCDDHKVLLSSRSAIKSFRCFPPRLSIHTIDDLVISIRVHVISLIW